MSKLSETSLFMKRLVLPVLLLIVVGVILFDVYNTTTLTEIKNAPHTESAEMLDQMHSSSGGSEKEVNTVVDMIREFVRSIVTVVWTIVSTILQIIEFIFTSIFGLKE